jgi:predicted component of type VI protein secretion system
LVLSGGDGAGLAESIPRVVKVTAREKSDELRRAAVGGVPLIPEGRRPHGIEVPSHAACFRIDRTHEHWHVVVKYGSFALLLPGGYTSLQPRLFTQEPHAFGS